MSLTNNPSETDTSKSPSSNLTQVIFSISPNPAMLWWILFVVSAIYFYVRAIKPQSHWRLKNVVHKRPWPIVGNMGSMVFRTRSFAESTVDLYQEYKTRYFGFYQFLQPTLLLKDPDLIKQIAIKDFESFLDHRTFISDDVDTLFGNNLFSLKGQKWRNMRSTLSPAFTGSKMRSMFVLINESAEQFTKFFMEECKANKTPLEIEMKDVFTRFANDVIATTAFGIQCDSLRNKDNEFYIKGKDASNFTGIRSLKFFGYTLSPLLMRLFKVKMFSEETNDFFRNLVKTTMITREQQGIIRHDMIHLLMEAKKGHLKHEENKDSKKDDAAGFATVQESDVGKGEPKFTEYTDDDLTAQAILFFIAGFDSISGNMCHLAHELAINPEIQDKLQAEIDETYDNNGGKFTYESVVKMKYLDMVVAEGLRKWPAAIITDRLCTKPYTIQPVGDEEPLHLEKGDICWLPIFAIHRDPEYYPEPLKFDPDRFSDENKDKINPMAYIPFGCGPRNCIGSRFALLEVKTVFVHLLKRFNLVAIKRTQIPIKLSRSTFNLNAEGGFWLGLEPRE